MNNSQLSLAMKALGLCIDKLQRINNMHDKQVYEPIHMSPNTYKALKGVPTRR